MTKEQNKLIENYTPRLAMTNYLKETKELLRLFTKQWDSINVSEAHSERSEANEGECCDIVCINPFNGLDRCSDEHYPCEHCIQSQS